MPNDRFYLEDPLLSQTCVKLKDQEFHHLVHVSRGKVNEHVELINGKGVLAKAQITSITKKDATLSIQSTHHFEPLNFTVILAQAIPRLNRLDTIIEKSTELGVDQLWLFPGKFSEKKTLNHNQLIRLKKILVSAAKQSGRLYLPLISMIPPISEWEPSAYPLLYGDLSPAAPPLMDTLLPIKSEEGLIFCIGPESGFHESEIAMLQKLKGKGVKLHQNILRTDTAPLAALALISTLQNF